MNDNDILALAKTAGCTAKQIEVLQLKAHGYGNGRIARQLEISTQAVRARLDGAYRRIRKVRST